MEEKIKNVLAYNLFEMLKKDKWVVYCEDDRCHNADCVVYKALEQYMEYEFKQENAIYISFEFLKTEDNK